MCRFVCLCVLALCLVLNGRAFAADLPPAATAKVDFQKDILPLLENHCVRCHNAEKQKSDLRMDSREFLLKGGSEGPSVVVGNSAESMMIALVTGTNPDFDQMPPKEGPLSAEQIGLLRAWIDQGLEWPADIVPQAKGGDEETAPGKAPGLPEDWRVEATHQQGALAQGALAADLKGPNGEPAITLTPPAPPVAEAINLLWTPNAKFLNGSIEVKTKVIGGTAEQGGGLIWRVKDKNNYYFASYNPASKKFSLGKVVEGEIVELGSADFEAPAGEWVTLRIEQQGPQYAGHLNEQKLVEGSDADLQEAGGAGYCAKGDAATAFAATKLNAQS
ncbi:MAG: hypothetical protein HYZ00_04420 [Candidatus Hydrogenedentes bacterium]|nr:hypothetical protein [Candidatus Hydrogenedentota bacterium]